MADGKAAWPAVGPAWLGAMRGGPDLRFVPTSLCAAVVAVNEAASEQTAVRDGCPWCGAAVSEGRPPSTMPLWRRWVCGRCRSMGYYRNPSAGELAQLYSTAWRDPTDTGAFAAGSTSLATAESLLAAVVPGLRGLGACLDYGAGRGMLAAALVAGGATDVSVLEPYGSQSTASGVVWFSSWEQMPVDKRFDWVFMVEVIEHLLDPIAELVKVRSRMAPGASLVVTTPNAGGWRARLSRTEWREAQNPTHINLFSPLALQRCLEHAGFRDIRRLRRPVRYKRGVAASALLALTQISGIDGGLRVLARAGRGARSRR